MAERIVLNKISYHGSGAITEIANELTARGLKKAFICSDPDLVKFGVTQRHWMYLTMRKFHMNCIPTLSRTLRLKMYRPV